MKYFGGEFLFVTSISIILALMRISGIKTQAFQAFAHLFVGALIGAYLINRNSGLLTAVIGLSVVELLCFIYFKYINFQK